MYTFVKRWHLLNVNAAFRQWRGAGMRDARMTSTVKRWLRSRLLSGFSAGVTTFQSKGAQSTRRNLQISKTH